MEDICEKTRLVCKEQYGSGPKKRSFIFKGNEDKLEMSENSSEYSSVTQFFQSVFLPQGYPDSVSSDYLRYQIWDTLQAFASSITGTLAAHAVLKGVGVGDENATVMAATMTWLLKDGAGMLGRIVFAWAKGSGLDCDAKRWRLFADLLNDFAFFLSIIAPVFGDMFTIILCIVGVFKSIVGVAGGCTRAALTQHQARRNNMADVSAKDGSQETLVNLAGLICSLALVPIISEHQIVVWPLFIVFTMLHVFANYKAVRSVCMESLNHARLHFIMDHYLRTGKVLDVKEANSLEPVVFPVKEPFKVVLGVSLKEIVNSGTSFSALKEVYEHSMTDYILSVNFKRKCINVMLSQSSGTLDQLQASFQAELINYIINKVNKKEDLGKEFQHLGKLLEECQTQSETNEDLVKSVLSSTLHYTESNITSFVHNLHLKGWVTDSALLKTDEWRALWDFNYIEDKKTN